MLIIHAPLTKPCEPPASLGYLAGFFAVNKQAGAVYDLNIEGIHFLLHNATPASDTWSRRASKNIDRNIRALQDATTYRNRDRYNRAVTDLNRILQIGGQHHRLQLSFSNYQDDQLNGVASKDLLLAAEQFPRNIFFPWFSKRLTELITIHHPQTIGFSISFLSQALCSMAMIGFLRDTYPELRIIIGGGLVTTWFNNRSLPDPMKKYIDHVVTGRGEPQLGDLLNIKEPIFGALPDFSQLAGNPYLAPGFILPYTTTFGCYWQRCSFCPETSEKNCYEQLPSDQVAADLKNLANQYQPALIHLLDNAIPPATLRTISATPPGAPWYGFTRFERVLENLAFCHQLRQSGCRMLKLGLESGSQKVLNAMQKGINLEAASRILNNLKQAGIATYVYLLFGTPHETQQDAMETMHFVERHHQAISFLNLAIFNMPANSVQQQEFNASDFYEGDLAIYRNFTHPFGWERAAIRRFLDTVLKRSTTIRPIILHDPPFFSSNHASFFNKS